MDILSHFGELDELIQIVYQGFDRFVVLSAVAEGSHWTLCVGLKGPEGRWWRGSWSASDITHFLGSKPSPKILEGFAHNLSEAFVNGELRIGGWVPDLGARINLTLKPTSKKPVEVPLVEISAKEAASHATMIFSGIALQAQGRKCQLNPPAFSAQTVAATATAGPSRTQSDARPKKAYAATAHQAEGETETAQQKIKALEAELEHVKVAKMKSKSPLSEPEPKQSVSARRPKGASLANPHKKARKYEAVEFESDGDKATV